MVGSLLKLTYNCIQHNIGVTFLFLAVVALLEQIHCSWFIILVFVSLKTTDMKAKGASYTYTTWKQSKNTF